tara:strand:- start:51 stop:323 length:273 start_codon:yes stop_codon:yes gene_type:complete
MKKTRKRAKKVAKVTWKDKLNDAGSWLSNKSRRAWDKIMGSAFDEEFPLAFGLMLTGGAILAGCLDPWKLIGLLGVVLGGVKLYRLLKWH